ncbi:MAG TPA: helix-turn-helix domain-containing protein [Byssovorax sp.]|jgi:AcrR family transcriptional regulator
MGIDERRAREKDRRRREILDAAWAVAREVGWSAFSVERVGAKAELGRATVYGYFESLDALVEAMADEALTRLSDRVSSTQGLEGALDAPVRFSQADPAAFALLFQATLDPRPAFSSEALARVRAEAQQLIRTLLRLAARPGVVLPEDAASAEAFLTGVAMAGVTVPELRSNTPLRRKWQDFCLSLHAPPAADKRVDAKAGPVRFKPPKL